MNKNNAKHLKVSKIMQNSNIKYARCDIVMKLNRRVNKSVKGNGI